MKRRYCAILFTVTVFTGSSATPAEVRATAPTFRSLYGEWRLVRVVAFGDPTGSEQDAEAGIGTIVTISAHEISDTHEPSAICTPRDPNVKFVMSEQILERDFGTTLKDIRLPRGLMKPRMPYMNAGCASAFVINERELLWPLGNGFYYLAKRESHLGS